MTESIQLKIQKVSSKMKVLHGLLLDERKKNTQLMDEMASLQSEILLKNEDLNAKERLIHEKESQLVQMNERNTVSVPEESLTRTHEIDELVKEIEYCISQLRK